jgi:hypothetical protein
MQSGQAAPEQEVPLGRDEMKKTWQGKLEDKAFFPKVMKLEGGQVA